MPRICVWLMCQLCPAVSLNKVWEKLIEPQQRNDAQELRIWSKELRTLRLRSYDATAKIKPRLLQNPPRPANISGMFFAVISNACIRCLYKLRILCAECTTNIASNSLTKFLPLVSNSLLKGAHNEVSTSRSLGPMTNPPAHRGTAWR